MSRDQKHPLAHIDKKIIEEVLVEGRTDYNVVEIARLTIRYRDFPGARSIQHDLNSILQQWQMSEDDLYSESRQIHQTQNIYRKKKDSDEQEDWS